MNKVITINLNGRAYQLEEAGYDALRGYLDRAAAALAGDPDKDEIMADFEQAIADKCSAFLRGGKNVVAAKEIEEIIAKMGPVDGHGAKDAASAAAGADGVKAENGMNPPKRLYRIIEGSRLRGVCTGIAAYFNFDVTLVRVLFVLLTLVTGGFWIPAYFILSLIMPVARTADEVAQAHGEPPFTAKDFFERARAEYEKYASDPTYDKHEWKQKMREWKTEWKTDWRMKREEERAVRREWRHSHRHDHCHGGRGTFGGIIHLVLMVIFVVALWSLIFHGMVFGHALGAGHPLWISIVFLCMIFYFVSLPFRHLSNWHHDHHRESDGVVFLLFLVALIYTAIVLFPPVREAWDTLIAYLSSIR